MGGKIRGDKSFSDYEKFLSPATKAGTEGTKGAKYAGKVLSNIGQQILVKMRRIAHYFETLVSKGPREWVNNKFISDNVKKISESLNDDLKAIKEEELTPEQLLDKISEKKGAIHKHIEAARKTTNQMQGLLAPGKSKERDTLDQIVKDLEFLEGGGTISGFQAEKEKQIEETRADLQTTVKQNSDILKGLESYVAAMEGYSRTEHMQKTAEADLKNLPRVEDSGFKKAAMEFYEKHHVMGKMEVIPADFINAENIIRKLLALPIIHTQSRGREHVRMSSPEKTHDKGSRVPVDSPATETGNFDARIRKLQKKLGKGEFNIFEQVMGFLNLLKNSSVTDQGHQLFLDEFLEIAEKEETSNFLEKTKKFVKNTLEPLVSSTSNMSGALTYIETLLHNTLEARKASSQREPGFVGVDKQNIVQTNDRFDTASQPKPAEGPRFPAQPAAAKEPFMGRGDPKLDPNYAPPARAEEQPQAAASLAQEGQSSAVQEEPRATGARAASVETSREPQISEAAKKKVVTLLKRLLTIYKQDKTTAGKFQDVKVDIKIVGNKTRDFVVETREFLTQFNIDSKMMPPIGSQLLKASINRSLNPQHKVSFEQFEENLKLIAQEARAYGLNDAEMEKIAKQIYTSKPMPKEGDETDDHFRNRMHKALDIINKALDRFEGGNEKIADELNLAISEFRIDLAQLS